MKARPLTLILGMVLIATWTTAAEAQLRPAIAPVAPGVGFGGGLGLGFGGGLGGVLGGGLNGNFGGGFGFVGGGSSLLTSSQAAFSYQQAYSAYRENRLKYEQPYFQMRRENGSYRDAMRQHATAEQIVESNKARLPGRLSPTEWDPGRGSVVWPAVLGTGGFANDRSQIDALFVARDADPQAAGLGSDNFHQIRTSIGKMSNHLVAEIKQISPDEYIAARKFLKRLEFEARYAPSSEVMSAN